MIRMMVPILALAVVFIIAGCCESRQQAAPGVVVIDNNDWFRQQTERFDRQHAEHVKNSSDAVGDYWRYRNR